MTDRIAVCSCGSPLIFTFAFSGREYYCLDCGRQEDIFADRVPTTARLRKRLSKLQEEWAKIGPRLLSGGVMLKDCLTCSMTGEPHIRHATDEERAAHTAAMERLARRVKAEAAA